MKTHILITLLILPLASDAGTSSIYGDYEGVTVGSSRKFTPPTNKKTDNDYLFMNNFVVQQNGTDLTRLKITPFSYEANKVETGVEADTNITSLTRTFQGANNTILSRDVQNLHHSQTYNEGTFPIGYLAPHVNVGGNKNSTDATSRTNSYNSWTANLSNTVTSEHSVYKLTSLTMDVMAHSANLNCFSTDKYNAAFTLTIGGQSLTINKQWTGNDIGTMKTVQFDLSSLQTPIELKQGTQNLDYAIKVANGTNSTSNSAACYGIANIKVNGTATIPEPTTAALSLIGLLGLVMKRRR